MTDEEKKLLLKVARNAIEHSLGITDEVVSIPYEGVFETMSGCFVTLHKHGDLRGCIGFIKGVEPLRKTIKEAALLAAKEDPRFSPVTASEWKHISIEISILSPPFDMPDYDSIVLGKHGLIVRDGYRSGLFLPQVPIEHNMDKDEFLTALCKKAGLPPRLWTQKQLQLQAFTAEVFSEEEFYGRD
jgi:AmmeMemoRadiSam system protein A